MYYYYDFFKYSTGTKKNGLCGFLVWWGHVALSICVAIFCVGCGKVLLEGNFVWFCIYLGLWGRVVLGGWFWVCFGAVWWFTWWLEAPKEP